VGRAVWKDLKPIAARTHEPAGYVVRESVDVVELLEMFYMLTGERRYLTPIPGFLAWLERTKAEAAANKWAAARYYEPGSNRPIYVVKSDKTNEQGYGLYLWTSDAGAGPQLERPRTLGDPAALRREYERVAVLSPEAARAAYKARPRRGRGEFPWFRASVEDVVARLDERGAWVTDRNRVLTVVPRA